MHIAGAVQVMVTDTGVRVTARWMMTGVTVTAGVVTTGITVRTGWTTGSEMPAARVAGAVNARSRMQRKNAGNHFIINPWIVSI
jgi:hypothetical protein